MHDIRIIRDDPAAFDAALARRGFAPSSAELLALDEARRAASTQGAGPARAAQRGVEGDRRRDGPRRQGRGRSAQGRSRRDQGRAAHARGGRATGGQRAGRAARGNPQPARRRRARGRGRGGQREVARWGDQRNFAFAPLEHADFGPALGLDFETGAAIAGARFTFLRGQMARLQRALAQFMLDVQTAEHGYTRMRPAAAGARRGDVRHRPAAQVRRGQLSRPPMAAG